MVTSHTVFDQIIDQIYRHVQLIVEKQDLACLCGGERFAEVLLGNVKKLDNIFILFQLLHAIWGKRFRLGKWFGGRRRDRQICAAVGKLISLQRFISGGIRDAGWGVWGRNVISIRHISE